MKACLPSSSNWRKVPVVFCILPMMAILGVQRCSAQQLSLTPVRPSQEINWIIGPKKANLGTLADIDVPQGYRLTGEAGARTLLERMKNPIPEGLVGILAPDSGKWWVVLTFTDVGYLKNADKEHIDPAAVLKAVQKRSETQNAERAEQGMSSIVSVEWEQLPAYDAENHSLEWAIRAATPSAKVINDSVLLLSRRGVLEIITVQPYGTASDSVPLQQLVKNITIKDGQRYTDYESGDKIADVTLSQLIVDNKRPTGSGSLMASAGSGIVVWIYSGLAGGVVLIGGAVFYQRRRQRRVRGAVYANGGQAIATARAAAGNGNGNGHGNGASAMGVKLPAIKVGASDTRDKLRRKKMFDYSKFYTHVVMELSSRSNPGTGLAPNGRLSNHTPGTQEGAVNQAIASATLDLIASQKNLIEEQKSLMQQQTRLIEERRKLIEEQNSLLKRQSEMIENQYSLKLE